MSRQQDIIERGYKNLNSSILRLITKTVAEDTTVDLLPVLQRLCETYPSKRRAVEDRPSRGEKRRKIIKHECSSTIATPPASCLFPDDIQLLQTEDLSVVQTPSHDLFELLQLHSPDQELLLDKLRSLINHGKVIWKGCSKAVLQLNEKVVAKIGQNLDTDDHSLLNLIIQQSLNIPMPKPLGVVCAGQKTCVLMTLVPGETLEKRWPLLTSDQKKAISSQLNGIFSELRQIPYKPATPLGSLSDQHLFKDTRAARRSSTRAFHTLAECHDWILSEPRERISSTYIKWLRSLLKDDHQIVLTHGDLHPRNVMVNEDGLGNVVVSGIIDWEMGGWYPEYWEELKALNTRGTDDDSDWWENLPAAITGYSELAAVHYLIEKATN